MGRKNGFVPMVQNFLECNPHEYLTIEDAATKFCRTVPSALDSLRHNVNRPGSRIEIIKVIRLREAPKP